MYVCISDTTLSCVYACMYQWHYIELCVCMYVSVALYIELCVCMYVCISDTTLSCVYVCMYVSVTLH